MKRDVKELFLDNHLYVVVKPSGLLTQPSPTSVDSLEKICKSVLKSRFGKEGNVFLEAIHRLDRAATGIVLFARTSKALKRLQEAQRNGAFKKEYLVCVEGKVEKEKDELTHYLTHGHFRAHTHFEFSKETKQCFLKYSVLERSGQATLLRIELYTGRYHQIRAQLAAIGHPVVGDGKYGATRALATIALMHYRLEMPHPISGERISFACHLDEITSFFGHPMWGLPFPFHITADRIYERD